MTNVVGSTSDPYTPGVLGSSTDTSTAAGPGVKGTSKGTGVWGESETWMGVYGHTTSTTGGAGVMGESAGTGVIGKSDTWMGVYGHTASTTGGAGVMGEGDPGPGVIGKSTQWIGVYGETAGLNNGPAGVWGEHKGAGIGVKAVSSTGVGLAAYSTGAEAVHAETQSPGTAAIAAYNNNPDGTGAALFAQKQGAAGHAGFFAGNVHVTGTLTADADIVLSNADCAEHFDIADGIEVEPGTLMVLGVDGALRTSDQAYDKRVAGVVSGAGDYRPGILLDRRSGETSRQPIALLGKVFCKVDATSDPIDVGDLLTTSATPGHAMKASDPQRAFGAVVGKALRPLREGIGSIPILIALQ